MPFCEGEYFFYERKEVKVLYHLLGKWFWKKERKRNFAIHLASSVSINLLSCFIVRS